MCGHEGLDTEDDIKKFIGKLNMDYPDNNLIDNRCDHEYFIEYVVLNFDENDKTGFKTLRRMMRAYCSYNDKR